MATVALQVLPAESSSYGGIEQFTEMVEAAKWEVHFAATAASQEELGCLQVPSSPGHVFFPSFRIVQTY